MDEDKKRIELLESALEQINDIIYANSIILGSTDYFKIRELATKYIKERLMDR